MSSGLCKYSFNIVVKAVCMNEYVSFSVCACVCVCVCVCVLELLRV